MTTSGQQRSATRQWLGLLAKFGADAWIVLFTLIFVAAAGGLGLWSLHSSLR